MEITFSGSVGQNIFGKVLNYHICTSIDGIDIYDDFTGTKDHHRTRVRTNKQYLYVKQYKPWNQEILVRHQGIPNILPDLTPVQTYEQKLTEQYQDLTLVERRAQAKVKKWMICKINEQLPNITDLDVKQILINHRSSLALESFVLCPNWNCNNDGCGDCPNANETCLMISGEN